MTNKEMQKTLEFIIERQEQFADNMQKSEERMSRFEGAFIGLFQIVSETTKAQRDLTADVKQIAATQVTLAEALVETNERLNIFINVVERYISRNGGNGESPSQN